MAEKSEDDIQEEGKAEPEAKKKGLSTSLLIKIAAGLGLLLVALIVSYFFLSKSADIDPETTEDTAQIESDTASEPAAEATEATSEDTEPEETIALPDVPATDTDESNNTDNAASEINPAVGMAATGAAAITNPVTQPSSKILSELVALQQQLANMQDENQTLIKRIEELAKENEALKSRTRQVDNTNPDAVINDDRLVNSDEIPNYYRGNGSSAPQPELEPKWGEFEEYNNGS